MISKFERDFMAADLASVEALLEELTDSDFIARMNLEDRRDEIKEALATAEARQHPLASAALFFGGQPVIGSRGIDSGFSGQVIARFQDIVSKVSAAHGDTTLAPVGRVPGKEQSRLYVTHIVHGSFGFQFEELEDSTSTTPMFDTSLKEAVDETVQLIAAFDEPEESAFEKAVESIDTRVLSTVRQFFSLVDNANATFRIVGANAEKQYLKPSVKRAVERAKETKIEERETWIEGRLAGVLPSNREFEYRTDVQAVLRGKIDKAMPDEQALILYDKWRGRDVRALVREKQIVRQGRVSHTTYILYDIADAVEAAQTQAMAE